MAILSSSSSSSSSTISVPAIVTGTGITLGTKYELPPTPQGSQYLMLKRFKDFSRVARSIAAADSEFGWTWDNRAEVTSGDENTTVANAARWNASTVVSDWFAGPYTAARRYKNFTFSAKSLLKPKQLLVRFSCNSSTAYTGIGVQITDSSDDASFLRYQIGLGAVSEKIISYLVTAAQETACTAQNLTDGIWLRMIFCDGSVNLDYNLAVQSTPPTTGWVRDRTVTFALDITKTYQIGQIQIVNVVSSGLQSNILYWDDSGLANDEDDAVNPTWCGQGYDTTNTAIQLLADYDIGSAGATLNQTAIRKILADIQNKRPGDAGAWTFSVKQSSTVSATEGSYAAAGSVAVEGSGRYANIWAKCNSDGTQPGSLLLPFLLPVTAS